MSNNIDKKQQNDEEKIMENQQNDKEKIMKNQQNDNEEKMEDYSETISINVILSDGRICPLNVHPDCTIAHVKKLLSDKEGFIEDEISFHHGGIILKDNNTLSSYDIDDSSFISVVFRVIGGGCFIKGTQISLWNGTTINIENVNKNHEIMSYDINNKKIVLDYVENIYEYQVFNIVTITLSNNQKIITTAGHPFYIEEINDFACVSPTPYYRTMKIGQTCLLYQYSSKQRQFATIINITKQILSQPIIVYTFVTKIHHNYFANDILVHNMSGPGVEFSASNVAVQSKKQTGQNNYAYYTIYDGFNYKEFCKNVNCIAGRNNQPILKNRGFGEIRPNEDQDDDDGIIICPGCRMKFDATAYYLYRCKFTINFKKKGDEKKKEEHIVQGSEYFILGEEQNTNYESVYTSLKFIVERLPN